MKIYNERQFRTIKGFLKSSSWYSFVEWVVNNLAENEIEVRQCRNLLASKFHIYCKEVEQAQRTMCKLFNGLYGVKYESLLSPEELLLAVEKVNSD